MSLRFHDTLNRKQFFVTLHKLFKRTHLEGRIFFNCYFGLTKYHIYEESTYYPIIKKKEKKVFEMGFSNKLKAVIQSPSEQTSVVNSHFTFHPHADQDAVESRRGVTEGSILENVARVCKLY